jgi:hypothetical protein
MERAQHGSAPNALVIETTGEIIASYQTRQASSPPAAVGVAIIVPIRPVVAIGMIVPMGMVGPVVAMRMIVIVPMGAVRPIVATRIIVTVLTDDHSRR